MSVVAEQAEPSATHIQVPRQRGAAGAPQPQFDEAVDLYSKAIALESSNYVYFSIRAAAHASLGRWREALDDAHER